MGSSTSCFIDPPYTMCNAHGLIYNNYDLFTIYGDWLPKSRSGTKIVFTYPCGTRRIITAKSYKQQYNSYIPLKERILKKRCVILRGRCPQPPGQIYVPGTELTVKVHLKHRPSHVMTYIYQIN